MVLAVAAVGVGIEVADECALDCGAGTGWSGPVFGLGQRKGQLADPARFGEADGGSRRVAHAVHRGLGLFAQADDQQALGGQASGACSSRVSLAPALYSPLESTAAAAAVTARIRGEKHWARAWRRGPFSVWVSTASTASSSVCNFGKICKGQGESSSIPQVKVLLESQTTVSGPTAVLAGVDGGAGLAVGLAAALGLALVPVLLALGQGQFALYPPVAEIKPGGDERVPLDLRL